MPRSSTPKRDKADGDRTMTQQARPKKRTSKTSTAKSPNSSIAKASTDPSAIDGGGNAPVAKLSKTEFASKLRAATEGDESQLAFVKATLAKTPELVEAAGNPSAHAEAVWFRRYAGSNLLTREALNLKAEHLKRELLGAQSSPLERLLVDRVVICWLQVSFHDGIEAGSVDRSLRQAEFDMKRQESMHRRYLRAIRTLAEVRRLERPALQVNIAENQVNLGGTVAGP